MENLNDLKGKLILNSRKTFVIVIFFILCLGALSTWLIIENTRLQVAKERAVVTLNVFLNTQELMVDSYCLKAINEDCQTFSESIIETNKALKETLGIPPEETIVSNE